jgi:8-oxo-dGTP diphosphatase
VSLRLVLVAACALIDADGRVLIAERPAGKAARSMKANGLSRP